MNPFLKWPGGKRWFVKEYSHILPTSFNRYIEPFLGGGSVFFFLKPNQAILGDSNSDLVNTYNAIMKDWKKVQSFLAQHQNNHSNEYYYLIRGNIPESPIEQAARMVYLNRTCFNGIYRVNKNGEFNVPRGTKNQVVHEVKEFEAVANLLKNSKIILSDFEPLINQAEKGDLVFADPPYVVSHNNNGFIKYNEKLFSWQDQERLSQALDQAKDKGVKIVSTNANTPAIRALYDNKGFHLMEVSRFSSISAKASSRRNYEELIILSHLSKDFQYGNT